MSKLIAVDFDGVIHRYSKGYCNGAVTDIPNEGAFKTLIQLRKEGYKLTIFTAREDIYSIREWIIKYVDQEEAMTPADKKYLKSLTVSNRKPKASYYLDDRAVKFVDWKSTLLFFKLEKK